MPMKLMLAWWNLLFIVPFGIALAYLVVFALTGIGGDSADADADSDVDTDVDADAHVEAHLDADVDADTDVDADADGDAHAEADSDSDHDAATRGGTGPSVGGMLGLLGVGKIPLSILLVVLCITFSVIGFLTNQVIWAVTQSEFLTPLVSIPVAFFSSLICTGGLARLVARYMPATETYARSKSQLVGCSGEAIYAIDDHFGMVSIRDAEGDLFQMPCRTAEGAEPIARGSRVVVFDYDEDRKIYLVAPYDPLRPRTPKRLPRTSRDDGPDRRDSLEMDVQNPPAQRE